MKGAIPFALTLAVAAITTATSANALDLLATSGTGPTGNCQAALPAYEGNIRKRPLAIVNESGADAFVTCALTSEEVSLNVANFWTRVSNSGTTPATVTCTAVVGDELQTPVYVPKSVTIAPGTYQTLNWNSLDYASVLLLTKSVAFSCNLPPNTALNRNSITALLSII